MESKPEVLIVSASTGTGHLRAGEALRQAFAAHGEMEAVHADLLELAPRWIRAAYGSGYELIASRVPSLWRELYHRTDSSGTDRARWGPMAHQLLFREFQRLLHSRRWRLCVCTHFLPGQLAAGDPKLPPFAMTITDLTLHRFWVQPRVGRYFVPTEAMAARLRHRLPGAQIEATGIPISSRFTAAPDRASARHRLGLDPRRPVALLMGGGLGLGVVEGTKAAVDAPVGGLQLLAVCGRNEAAAARLRALGHPESRLRVFGYVDEIEQLISAADIVVTKPGGLTTSEALALGRPLLLTRPIPGQEEGNTRALVAAGAALETSNPGALRTALEGIFTDTVRLRGLSEAARAIGRPRAAESVVHSVWQECALHSAA